MKRRELKDEILERKNQKKEIRTLVNDFCVSKYGIENFFGLVDEYFPNDSKNFQICLSRQVPTPNIEHLALYLSSKKWGIKPVFLSFPRDAYPKSEINGYKKSLVCSPRIFKGRRGNLVLKNERISSYPKLPGAILGEIMDSAGKLLPDIHLEMLEKAIPKSDYILINAGELFCEIFSKAKKNLPEYAFIKEGMHEKKVEKDCFCKERDLRPPADWYYFFHLMIFLDGSYGLASTVDEDPEVIAWFDKNKQLIKDICGFSPLIINTPPEVETDGFFSKLNEIPQKAFGGNGFLHSLSSPVCPLENICFFDLMEHYEKELIAQA